MAEFSALTPDDPRMVAGYALHARLGAGGMGRVYLSFTPGGRPIAIKVIRPEFAADEEFRRRFRQEIATAQRVQGIYTAPVIDADADAPVPWLATAYVPGPSLRQAVEEHGPMPVPTALRMVAGVAEALAGLHAAGLVHRDLKPANVLLAADGPRVIDFGIARAADATALTRTGVQVGTPAFMTPEQVRGRPVTPATDVFALGQLAVYAATARPAFGEGPAEALLFRIADQEPDLGSCPAELRDLAARCLDKSPEARPQPSEIMNAARERAPGPAVRLAESWLPAALAEELDAYDTARVPPRPSGAGPAGAPSGTPAGTPAGAPGSGSGSSAPRGAATPDDVVPWAGGPPMAETTQRSWRGLSVPAMLGLAIAVALAVVAGAFAGAAIISANRTESPSEGAAGGAAVGETSAPAGAGSAEPVASPPPPESSGEPPDESRLSTFAEDGYRIGIPKGWTRRTVPSDDSGSVYWDSPDGISYVLVDPRRWERPRTARAQADLAHSKAQQNTASFPGYRLIGITDLSYRGSPAADWEFSFDAPDGLRIRAQDRFFKAGGGQYAIYIRAPSDSWSSLQNDIEQIYTSFQST